MANLFVDASGKKPKCYWEGYSCPKGKWYSIKTGLEPLFIFLLLLKLIIGLLIWALLDVSLYIICTIVIIGMAVSYFTYPDRESYTILQKSKSLDDILIDDSPIYITVSKSLRAICFIIPEKKYMFFKTIGHGDDRINVTSSMWYVYKNKEPYEIRSRYFEDPIKDLKSKLNYDCNLHSVIDLNSSQLSRDKVLKCLQDLSFSIFNK